MPLTPSVAAREALFRGDHNIHSPQTYSNSLSLTSVLKHIIWSYSIYIYLPCTVGIFKFSHIFADGDSCVTSKLEKST